MTRREACVLFEGRRVGVYGDDETLRAEPFPSARLVLADWWGTTACRQSGGTPSIVTAWARYRIRSNFNVAIPTSHDGSLHTEDLGIRHGYSHMRVVVLHVPPGH
jgi:hypothetical protein